MMFPFPYLLKRREEERRSLEDLLGDRRVLEEGLRRCLADLKHVKYCPVFEECSMDSYYVAASIIVSLRDSRYLSRFCDGEAKNVYWYLGDFGYPVDLMLKCCKVKGLRVRYEGYRLYIHFTDYLRVCAKRLSREGSYKLVNRRVRGGWVEVSPRELGRILAEYVYFYLYDTLSKLMDYADFLPDEVVKLGERVRRAFPLKYSVSSAITVGGEEVKWGEVLPPCALEILRKCEEGVLLSHAERFFIVAFLSHVNPEYWDEDRLVDLFRRMPDFNEEKTRYQVRHILGKVGSRRWYLPFSCANMRTHGLCRGDCDKVMGIRNPLGYVRKKMRRIKSEKSKGSK